MSIQPDPDSKPVREDTNGGKAPTRIAIVVNEIDSLIWLVKTAP
ncbi:hypothetical protein [uncultured Algoriphagus sp.]